MLTRPGWLPEAGAEIALSEPRSQLDAGNSRICFLGIWQHDQINIIDWNGRSQAALAIDGGAETEFLQASDAVLRRICAVADKIHRRSGNSCCVCVLAAKDFIILRTSYCAWVACSGR